MNNNNAYYPLATGNSWTYKLPNGGQFTNTVLSESGVDAFVMKSSLLPNDIHLKKEGSKYYADTFEPGNMQETLSDDAKVGDTWELRFKANGFENIQIMTVKELLRSKTVADNDYSEVLLLEGELKMVINNNVVAINFFTQYYYAKGVGLILTTTSAGDSMPLIIYELK